MLFDLVSQIESKIPVTRVFLSIRTDVIELNLSELMSPATFSMNQINPGERPVVLDIAATVLSSSIPTDRGRPRPLRILVSVLRSRLLPLLLFSPDHLDQRVGELGSTHLDHHPDSHLRIKTCCVPPMTAKPII